jgi:hypothetical protein
MSRMIIRVLLVALLGASSPAFAGPFADDMAKCLVNSTSPADRTVFVRWMFSLITLHPDLTAMSNVTPQQRDQLTRQTGALFQKLLLESCRVQTRRAVQNEGPQTIQYAFQVLGQSATVGMLSDPHVADAAKTLAQYMDEEKLKALLATAPQK